MALKIENEKIVGTIDDLKKKLDGKLPVTREELLILVNSWGRKFDFNTFYQNATSNELLVKKTSNNQTLRIDRCELKECYNLSKLDVSQITNMENLFMFSNFNGDISNWNTSNVTNMRCMFRNAKAFNQDINSWNVSNVTNMESMFFNASSFNQPLNFDTSNVTTMEDMFYQAKSFNQPLNFDTSKVVDMEGMFFYASSFDQAVNFDTSSVTNMDYMFYNAEIFNQPINFNTSKVIYMSAMFSYAKAFNQTINFDILNVEDMELMFNNATAFKNKYNKGESFPLDTKEIKKWFNINRDKMNEIDIKDQHGVELNNFFSNIKLNIIEKT